MKELSTSQKFESSAARGMLAMPAGMLRIMAGKPVVKDGLTLDVQCQLLLKIMKMRGVTLGGKNAEVGPQRKQMDAQSLTLELDRVLVIGEQSLMTVGKISQGTSLK